MIDMNEVVAGKKKVKSEELIIRLSQEFEQKEPKPGKMKLIFGKITR